MTSFLLNVVAVSTLVALALVESRLIQGRVNPANEFVTLQRRIWNDEVQPCIERYCYNFLYTDGYGGCIRRYCRRSVRMIQERSAPSAVNPASLTALAAPPQLGSDAGLAQAWLSLCKSNLCADDADPGCVDLKCVYKQRSEVTTNNADVIDE